MRHLLIGRSHRSAVRTAGLAAVVLLVLALPVRRAAAVIPLDQWTYHLVSNAHLRTFSLNFGDVDRDGRTDIVSGRYWYRNPGGDLLGTWSQENFPSGMSVFGVADVDGDAFTDVFAQKTDGDLLVYWLEATDAGATDWQVTSVGSVPQASHFEGAQGYCLGQLETGGRPEVVIASGDGIFYFRIPADSADAAAGNWPRVHVHAAPWDEGFAFGDIDGDGQLDIAATTGDLKGVVWLRNPGDGSELWALHAVGTFTGADSLDRTELADLNGDGRLDIIVTEENGLSSGAETIWWQQPVDPVGGTWQPHLVTTWGTTNSMDVADFDQDGDVDVVLAEHRGALRVAIWSSDGAGTLTEHVISTGRESHLGVRICDLDGDGDLDLVSIAWDTNQNLHLWRNDADPATAVPDVGDLPAAGPLVEMAAWPNPFNPAVEITVTLNGEAPLSVTIHDVAGRRVRELFTGTAAATVRLRWDGVGDDGRRQPSGVYLLRAVSGAQVLSDRLGILE